MSQLASFLVLVTLVATYSMLAAFADTRLASNRWYVAQNQESVRDKLMKEVYARIEERTNVDRVKESLTCLPDEVDPSSWADHYADADPESVLPGPALLAIFALEDVNRPPLIRGLELFLGNLSVTLGFGVPDWTYGPLQISIAAAQQVRSEVDDPTVLFRQIADACSHGEIGLDVIRRLTEVCNAQSPSSADALACMARDYNGDSTNPLGPTYTQSLLVAYYAVLGNFFTLEPGVADVPSGMLGRTGRTRAPENGDSWSPGEIDLAVAKSFLRIVAGDRVACDRDFLYAVRTKMASVTASCGEGADDLARSNSLIELLQRANDTSVQTGDRIDQLLILGALGREHQMTLRAVAPPDDLIRRHQRFASALHDAAWLALSLCTEGTSVGTAFCDGGAQLYSEAVTQWKKLLQTIQKKNHMGDSTTIFGPASFSIEALAWRLVLDTKLRGSFEPGELRDLSVLLEKGTRHYGKNDPRYLGTLSVFSCLSKGGQPLADLADLSLPGAFSQAHKRNAFFECARDVFHEKTRGTQRTP